MGRGQRHSARSCFRETTTTQKAASRGLPLSRAPLAGRTPGRELGVLSWRTGYSPDMAGLVHLGRDSGRRLWRCVGLVFVGVVWAVGAQAAPSLKLGELRPLDASPDRLPYQGYAPAVASDGQGWLAVFIANGGLTAQRLDGDGSLSGDGFAVGPSDTWVDRARVVFDGADFLIAFQAPGVTGGFGFQRITAGGAEPFVALDLPGDGPAFDLAVDSDGAPWIFSCDSTYVKSTCAAVELAGAEPIAHASFELPFPVVSLELQFSGGTALAVVETEAHAVVLLEISSEGQLITSASLEAGDATGGGAYPTLVATQDGYAAAWHRKDGIRVVALSGSGEIVGDQLAPGDGSFTTPILLASAENLLLVSRNVSAVCGNCVSLYAQVLSLSLDVEAASPVLIADDALAMFVAAAASSKTLVVFLTDEALEAAVVDSAQPAANPGHEPIAFTAPPHGAPVIATAPDGWLVAWQEQGEFRSARVDLDGRPRPFALDLPESAAAALALEEGDGGWLLVWAGETVNVSRLDPDGVVGGDAYELGNPQWWQVARSSAGWLVLWSPFSNSGERILHAEFFDFNGVHQSSQELLNSPPNYVGDFVPFDLAATPSGFQVVWSIQYYGISSLELDAHGQPTGDPRIIHEGHADALHLAATSQASWLGYRSGPTFFTPLPFRPEYQYFSLGYLMGVRVVAGAAVLAWADQYAGFSGSLSVAAPGEFSQEPSVTFPTYGYGYGFAFSEAIGNRALIATQATLRHFGVPQSRLVLGVVTVVDSTEGEGGAGGGGDGGGGGGDDAGAAGTGIEMEPGVGGATDGGAGPNGGVPSVGGVSTQGGEPNPSASMGGLAGDVGGDGDGELSAGTGSSARPKTSSGCGCELGKRRTGLDSGLALMMLAALVARRRVIRDGSVNRER